MWSILSFGALLVYILSTPLSFFSRQRKRKLPILPDRMFATVEGLAPLRIRQWRYVRSVYALMTDEELNLLSDLFYAQREWNREPTPEQAAQASTIITATVKRWLDTEMGRAWRADNFR